MPLDAEGLLYRLAYGDAYRMAEADSYDMQSGRYRGKHPAIRAEALRRYGDSEPVREGIDDALAGRRPKW